MFQDHLTSELRLARAAGINSVNAVLRKFIAGYNRRFNFAGAKAQIYQAFNPDSEVKEGFLTQQTPFGMTDFG